MNCIETKTSKFRFRHTLTVLEIFHILEQFVYRERNVESLENGQDCSGSSHDDQAQTRCRICISSYCSAWRQCLTIRATYVLASDVGTRIAIDIEWNWDCYQFLKGRHHTFPGSGVGLQIVGVAVPRGVPVKDTS